MKVMVKTCLEWTEATLLIQKPSAKPLKLIDKLGKLQHKLISKVPDRMINKLPLNNSKDNSNKRTSKDNKDNVSSRLSKANSNKGFTATTIMRICAETVAATTIMRICAETIAAMTILRICAETVAATTIIIWNN